MFNNLWSGGVFLFSIQFSVHTHAHTKKKKKMGMMRESRITAESDQIGLERNYFVQKMLLF